MKSAGAGAMHRLPLLADPPHVVARLHRQQARAGSFGALVLPRLLVPRGHLRGDGVLAAPLLDELALAADQLVRRQLRA
eukprot:2361351-Pyramimonas_sp.AAC.1